MSCKGLTGKALMNCKAKQKATVTTASVKRVNNDKVKRKSLSTIESENRVFQKKVKGSRVKRKSATLQDDGSLVIATNSSSNPVGRTRTIRNKKRAAKKFANMTERFNKKQNRFNKRARE